MALWDVAPGRGRKASLAPERIQSLVETACPSAPGASAPWTCRQLAAQYGISKSRVSAILSTHHIGTSRIRNAATTVDVPQGIPVLVGMYVNRPYRAIVVRVPEPAGGDEWQAVSGMNRQQNNGERKREDVRVVLESLSAVAGKGYTSQRHKGLLTFLRRLAASCSSEFRLHVVVDLPEGRKRQDLRSLLRGSPRFFVHFVQTRNTWVKTVAPGLAVLLGEAFDHVGAEDLSKAILEFLWLANPAPFVWMRHGSNSRR